MAVVIGTSSGFVSTAPTTNPAGTETGAARGRAVVTKDTSPSTAIKITELGFYYVTTGSPAGNYTIGVYAADGGSGSAGTLLYSQTVSVSGFSTGWKKVTGLDISISSSTVYWLGVNLSDGSVGNPNIHQNDVNGYGKNFTGTGYTSLPADYTGLGTSLDADGMYAIYAVWQTAASGPSNLKSYNTNLKANIKTINTNPIANIKSLDTNV